MNGQFQALLERLSTLEIGSPEWGAVVAEILTVTKPLVHDIAKRVSQNRRGVAWGRDADDIIQEVTIVLYQMLGETGAGGDPPSRYINFDTAFVTRARGRIRDWSTTGEVLGFSGMSDVARRTRKLYHGRAMMAYDTGVEPDDATVVAAYNEHLDRRSKDDRIHTARATIKDFTAGQLTFASDLSEHESSDPATDDAAVAAVAGDVAIGDVEAIVAEAGCVDERLGAVAELWLESCKTGSPRSAAEVGRRLGFGVAEVRVAIARLRVMVALRRMYRCEAPDAVVTSVVASASAVDTITGHVARRWFAGWPDAAFPTPEDMAVELGQPLELVSRALAKVTKFLGEAIIVDAAR